MSDNTNSAQERTASIDLAQLDKLPVPDLRYHAEYRRGYIAAKSDIMDVARRSLTSDHREATSGAPAALSYADAAQWARDNGFKVPDAWLAGSAAKTEQLAARIVSVDVSTGDDDAGNRIFAELTGETGSDGTTLLAIETSRNFTVAGAGSAQQAGTKGAALDERAGHDAALMDVSKLTRFSQWSNSTAHGMEPKAHGRWVRFEEVVTMAQQAAPEAPSRDAGQEEASTQTVPDGAAVTVEKDAARYQWIRKVENGNAAWDMFGSGLGGLNLDSAIDASIEAHNKAGKEQG